MNGIGSLGLSRLLRAGAARGAAITVGGNLAGAGGALAASIVAARTLTHPEFAIFGVGLALNSLTVQLADLGLGVVAVAETAPALLRGELGLASSKFSSLSRGRVRSASFVVSMVALAVIAIPGMDSYRGALLVAAGGALPGCISLFLIATLQASRRFGQATTVLGVISVLRLIFVSVAAAVGGGPIMMLAGYTTLAPLIGCIVAVPLVLRSGVRSTNRAARPRIKLDASRKRLMLVGGLASAAVFNGDILLLVAVSDRKQVAIYAAAWRIAAGLSIFNSAIASALLPYIMTSDQPRRDVRRLACVGLALAAFFLLLLPAVVPTGLAVLGNAGHNAGNVLALLVAAFALDTFISFVYQSYIRVGHTALPVANVIIELGLMSAVTIIFRSHGAIAPACGQLVARAVGVVIIGGPIFLERRGRLSWFDSRAVTG